MRAMTKKSFRAMVVEERGENIFSRKIVQWTSGKRYGTNLPHNGK